jgi:hypothetical protein
MYMAGAIGIIIVAIIGFAITFWHFDGNLLDPNTWPIPQFDRFYIGLGAYYDKFIEQNGKMFPLIGWAVYLILNSLSIHLPFMKDKKQSIPSLLKALLTGTADEVSTNATKSPVKEVAMKVEP